MSSPNRTVAAARNRKSIVVREERFAFQSTADDVADAARAKGESVRVTSFKSGPRNKPVVRFMVRWYEAI